MSDTVTTNFGFTEPEEGASSNTWGAKLNADLAAIDAELKTLADAIATKLPSASYTAADILAKIKTVDGTGSGLDADTIDGLDSAALGGGSPSAAAVLIAIKTVDGTGSGLDADLLDGVDASGFASSTHTHTAYVPKDGTGAMTANLPRASAGPHLYFASASFTSPRVFVTVAGAPDPTSQPGDIWIELS